MVGQKIHQGTQKISQIELFERLGSKTPFQFFISIFDFCATLVFVIGMCNFLENPV